MYENLGSFPPVCDKFKSLNRIVMSHVGINYVAKLSLEQCTSLAIVLNTIKIFPALSQQARLLHELYLSDSLINHLQHETFNGHDKLEKLFLEQQQNRSHSRSILRTADNLEANSTRVDSTYENLIRNFWRKQSISKFWACNEITLGGSMHVPSVHWSSCESSTWLAMN